MCTDINLYSNSLKNVYKSIQIDNLTILLIFLSKIFYYTFLDTTPFKELQTKVNFELHMMVKDPLMYLERFASVGFKRFFAHIEGSYVEEYIAKCYQLGVEVGLAIDGPTPFEKIQDYIDNVDCILVMAIEAGFSGQPFRQDTVEKIKKIRKIDFEIPLAVDGAMNEENARKVIEAGATRINSNSYIFKSDSREEAIKRLKALDKAVREQK